MLASREALENLKRAMKEGGHQGHADKSGRHSLHYAAEGEAGAVAAVDIAALMRGVLVDKVSGGEARVDDPTNTATMGYAAALGALLAGGQCWDRDDWCECVAPYLADGLAPQAGGGSNAPPVDEGARNDIALAVQEAVAAKYQTISDEVDDDAEGEDACNIESFSLAYGGKVRERAEPRGRGCRRRASKEPAPEAHTPAEPTNAHGMRRRMTHMVFDDMTLRGAAAQHADAAEARAPVRALRPQRRGQDDADELDRERQGSLPR